MVRGSVLERARVVVEACVTEEGFNASTGAYRELWLRDLVYSEEPLLGLGYGQTVRRHLETFLRHQLKGGQLPTVVSKGWRRIFNQRFHSWTADTEILFLIGAANYTKLTGDSDFLGANHERLDRCLEVVERKLNHLGLIPGADWRDAVVNHQGRFLLSNQALLVDMYDALGRRENSDNLKETIRDVFDLSGFGYLADCAWWEGRALRLEPRLDCMGNSLSILNGVLSGKAAVEAARRFEAARTAHGYRNLAPPISIQRSHAFSSVRSVNSFVRNGAVFRNRRDHYQNSAIWPLVEGKIVAAFRKLALEKEARELSVMMMQREGFHEWYSPVTGQPGGSSGQLWTAAAVIDQALAAENRVE